MPKILIIEDDTDLRDVYEEQFRNENFEVVVASDGEDGINKAKSFMSDLIILDMLMPNMDGFEFLKRRKEDSDLSKIPVVITTNLYADTQDLIKNWGVSFVLLKVDYTPGQLVETVRGVLENAH